MAAMRVCSTPNCPAIHERGGKCDQCRAEADQSRRPDGNPYSTPGHRAFRSQVLAIHPFCQCQGECKAHTGLCGQRSTIADHWPTERRDLVQLGLDPNDPTRGRGLCKKCHDSKTAHTTPGGWNARD